MSLELNTRKWWEWSGENFGQWIWGDQILSPKTMNPAVGTNHNVFPGKFMHFSEAATGGVLWKKLVLKILQYSQ